MGARLVCLGNTVIDVTVHVPELPARGGDILADHGAMLAGGSGFNVLAAARRLGVPAAYGGAHGTGPFGDLARRAMRSEGIDILIEPIGTTDTGWDVAITDAGSERTFLTVTGAENHLTHAQLALVTARPGDVVYVSGYGLVGEPNRSAITGWLETLPETVTVVFDPGPLVSNIPRETLDAVLARTTWWSSNLVEASAVTGETGAGETAAVNAARALARAGPGVIIRLGVDGCLVLAPGAEPVPIPAFAVDPVDSNGAGDAHVGAFIAGLLTGLEPHSAARRANAAAAIAVTRFGPATGPTTLELDEFLDDRTVK